MKRTIGIIAAALAAATVVAAMIYGGWKLERELNWKFSYGTKVQERIDRIERRLDALEMAPVDTLQFVVPASQVLPDSLGVIWTTGGYWPPMEGR